jgi:hypothetical protein
VRLRELAWLCIAILVLGWTTRPTTAQQKPAVPVTLFPGVNPGLACTPVPGPPVRETPAVHRQVLKFLNEAQQGRFDPKITGFAFRYDPRGVKNFFSQIGPVEKLTFRHGDHGCSKDDFGYDYHIEGRDRIANLSITIVRGRIEGYVQRLR